jgi:cell division protein FtsQ
VNQKKRSRTHGASVNAPPEEALVFESPPPGAVAAQKAPSVPPGGNTALVRATRILRLLAGLVVVVGASAAVAYSVHRYALTTPRFAIRELDLAGQKRLSRQEIEGLAGIEVGKNLFSFDTVKAEKGLLGSPWVKSAKISRVLPGSLKVEIQEREARALALLGDELFLLTADGEPFKSVVADDPIDLPVVTGVSAAELGRNRDAAEERLRAGLEILTAYDRLELSRVHKAQEVNLATSGDATLTIGKSGIALELGHGPYPQKLAMACRVIAELSRKKGSPALVFLDNRAHPERVVVRMR